MIPHLTRWLGMCFFFVGLGACTSSPSNGGPSSSMDAGSVDLIAPCAAHCGAIRSHCGAAPAACETECECREAARPSCRALQAAYLDCAARAVLTCPSGEPAVLCRDQRETYEACRANTTAMPGVTCTASDAGAADVSSASDAPTDTPAPQDVRCPDRCLSHDECACATTPPGSYRCCYPIPRFGFRCAPRESPCP